MEIINVKYEDKDFFMNPMEQMSEVFTISRNRKNIGGGDI